MTLQNTTYDINTGETIIRDYNPEEIKEYEDERIKNKALNDALEAEANAKAAQRRAILEHLGITEEEARILLGGN